MKIIITNFIKKGNYFSSLMTNKVITIKNHGNPSTQSTI
ncbi:hypothetical protein AO366_0948 [Moraxella catarrhalis]|uniref:Uncharacterized protein n=1 Tax=Moraxella catarrhalis TaxID=480 RepID=A0AB36DNM6_MORCA|nr:hypothetical protein AO381_0763 [Moraxella catarrhalis]OAV25500.1 hypothetical protein AO370_0970 [Moraxella catarrhalis]OAV33673.1 hypothetical protein AO366_0948 [Moraxella catarrhalis]